MSYKVTINNKTFDLPKCTLGIEEMVENMRDLEKGVQSGEIKKRQLVEQMIEFLNVCIGEEKAKELLDFTSIEDIDTKELEIAVSRIMQAFSNKTITEKMNETKKIMADINSTMNMNNLKQMLEMMSVKK